MTIALHVLFVVVTSNSFNLFPSVDINDFILVDVFKYVWCVHEDSDGSHCGHDEKDVQLKTVNNHGYEFPIFANLNEKNEENYIYSVCKNYESSEREMASGL
jgi:hypothetical protein